MWTVILTCQALFNAGKQSFHIKDKQMHKEDVQGLPKPPKATIPCRYGWPCQAQMARIGGLLLWIIYDIQVPKLIKVFARVHLNLFCTIISNNDELQKTCYLSVWILIEQRWLWERFMKSSVIRSNRLQKSSGYYIGLVSIGLLCLLIFFSLLRAKDARSANNLVILN